MSNEYYDQLMNANFASDYKTPDWYKKSGLALDQTPEKLQQFFDANPQYAEDWKNITSGGTSAFATDGSSLLRTPSSAMSSEAAAHFASNPYEQLAYEGFGQDPTLSYMNYTYGPSSIGMTNPKDSKTQYLRDNRWTPGGVMSGNNININGYRYGDGTMGGSQSYSTRPLQVDAQGNPIASTGQTGGSASQSYGGGSSGYGSGGGGASYGGGGGSMSSNFAMNPYLQQMGDMMAGTMTNNWQRGVQPQIASGAMAAGGYGGSRHGVAEANSANDLNQGIGSALSSLYGNGYNTGLQYDLGTQNVGLGYANLDRNINNDNLNWQMQGANFGLGIYDRMQQANNLGLQTGSQIQNTPLTYWNQFSQGANSIGQGYDTSTSTSGGNPLMGAIGGAQLGGQIGNWWSSQSPNAAGGANSQGWGTGSGYGNQDFGSYF